MVRTITASGASRLVLGYNDAVGQFDAMGNYLTNFSLLGLSISNDGGVTWDRRGQLPAGTTDVPALCGDPWLAAAGSLVLYVGMRCLPGGGPNRSDADGVVLAVSTDGAETWDTITTVHEGSVDGPKVAVKQDGSVALIVWIEPRRSLVGGCRAAIRPSRALSASSATTCRSAGRCRRRSPTAAR